MNVKIITLDKTSERFVKEAIAEYSKRLSKYCKLSLKECRNEDYLIKELRERSYAIYLSSQGNMLSSEELANKFSELALSGKSDVTFLISSSELSQKIVEKVDFNLAVSRMNIDFGVLLVILFEQIYRLYRINSNEPYHK
jgi:23S rRNA (pseudouridine1915-N3)-methyltransferase